MSLGGRRDLTHFDPPCAADADARIYVEVFHEGEELGREELWARQLSAEGEFEIACIPFFTYSLALGDRVAASRVMGQWLLQGVLQPSGHFTYRVWFGDAPARRGKESVVAELTALGAATEWSSNDLLAVDAASEELAELVVDRLSVHEEHGELTWESGQ